MQHIDSHKKNDSKVSKSGAYREQWKYRLEVVAMVIDFMESAEAEQHRCGWGFACS